MNVLTYLVTRPELIPLACDPVLQHAALTRYILRRGNTYQQLSRRI